VSPLRIVSTKIDPKVIPVSAGDEKLVGAGIFALWQQKKTETKAMQSSEREYTLEEIAQVLGVSSWTVRRMIRDRVIGHYRPGNGRGRLRVLESQLSQYRKARTVAPVAAAA
jgi:excisionase family DNA binding protein